MTSTPSKRKDRLQWSQIPAAAHFGIGRDSRRVSRCRPRMALSNSFCESRGRRLLKAAIHHSNWIQMSFRMSSGNGLLVTVDDDLLGNRRPATRVAELRTRKNIDNDR